jgi:hypothetical protein
MGPPVLICAGDPGLTLAEDVVKAVDMNLADRRYTRSRYNVAELRRCS